MAYVADLSCWDTASTANFAEKEMQEEINFELTPGSFALAPIPHVRGTRSDFVQCVCLYTHGFLYISSPRSILCMSA